MWKDQSQYLQFLQAGDQEEGGAAEERVDGKFTPTSPFPVHIRTILIQIFWTAGRDALQAGCMMKLIVTDWNPVSEGFSIKSDKLVLDILKGF